MDVSTLVRLENLIACDQLRCVKACPCPELTLLAQTILDLGNADDVSLFIDLLCGLACTTEPVPDDGPPQTQPDPTPERSCIQQLRAAVCTENVIAGINTLQIVITGIQIIQPTSTIGVYLATASGMLEALEEFCADPTGGVIDATLSRVCVAWPAVQSGMAGILDSSLIPQTLKDALSSLFGPNSALALALTACCRSQRDPGFTTQPFPAVNRVPITTVAGRGGTQQQRSARQARSAQTMRTVRPMNITGRWIR